MILAGEKCEFTCTSQEKNYNSQDTLGGRLGPPLALGDALEHVAQSGSGTSSGLREVTSLVGDFGEGSWVLSLEKGFFLRVSGSCFNPPLPH